MGAQILALPTVYGFMVAKNKFNIFIEYAKKFIKSLKF